MLVRFLRLAPERRLLLVRALGWVALVKVALPVIGFQSFCRWLSRDRRVLDDHTTLHDVRWAIVAASRRVPGATCLVRSLALQGLLRRSALATELCIGVARRPDGSLTAHAWVTHEGRPVLADEDLSAYTPLPALPG